MASSPSTWAWSWSWNTTIEPSSRLSLFCNPSSSHTLQHRNKRTQLTIFSLDSSSSSDNCRNGISSSPVTKPTSCSPTGNRLDICSTQLGRLGDRSLVPVRNEETESDAVRSMLQWKRWRRVGLKMLGKRPLWKRIFFASKKVRSIILLNVITVIYASDIPVIKEVEDIMDPALFTCVRFAVSAIPFLPFILRAREDGQTRAAGIELGFWVSLGYLAQALGLLTSDAGRASFISAFTVITVPLIDGMLGAKVPVLTWCGAILTLVGVALLESSGSPPSVGDILNILSAVFFGIHLLRTEHISRVTKKEKYLALLGYQVCIVALFSTIWYFCMGGFDDVHGLISAPWRWSVMWDWVASFPWIPALYTGVFSTGLCLWLEMGAMCDVSATETAIIYGLEPVWGAAFAWFLLGERWGTTGWVGAALVLGGSLTVQIWGSSPERSETDKGSCREIQVSDEQKEFSISTVVASSNKNVPQLLKKNHSVMGSVPIKTRKR
ncbi:hypothetical protein AAC387_Pa02g4967 [Persea americana]